jgi:membrane protein DedA with SNARE-associated domain
VFALIQTHQVPLILGFRFLYGLRNVTPFLIGASGVAPLRYLILNLVGAGVWSVAVGVLGYILGHALELFLEEAKRYELWAFAALALIGVTAWGIRWYSEHRRSADKPVKPTP